MSFCREGGLRVETAQMRGNCFHFYVRFPGGWNGTRAIYHIHEGPCRPDCEPCCQGFNEQAAALVLLLIRWAEQAEHKIEPTGLNRKRSLDEVVADIAKGMHGRSMARRKRTP